jgi:hypothetical protein
MALRHTVVDREDRWISNILWPWKSAAGSGILEIVRWSPDVRACQQMR